MTARTRGRDRLLALDHELLIAAGRLAQPSLRAPDAIHVAAAISAGAIDAFVTYDERQALPLVSSAFTRCLPPADPKPLRCSPRERRPQTATSRPPLRDRLGWPVTRRRLHVRAPDRYGAVVATNEKPAVKVPSDQPPSYQLELEDIIVGSGDEAVAGRVVEVHYVGVSWRTGEQFDASWDRGDTFKFGLGKGQVIPGWDQGVAGMKIGGRRRITIPPMLAYGKRGAGGVIGPDETLVFVIDLIAVG